MQISSESIRSQLIREIRSIYKRMDHAYKMAVKDERDQRASIKMDGEDISIIMAALGLYIHVLEEGGKDGSIIQTAIDHVQKEGKAR